MDALLEPPKIRIWMPKRRQDAPPKLNYFSKNLSKILTIPIFGPRCFLEASQEPPKSLPRGSQEAYKPSGGTQEPPRSSRAAPKESRATAQTSKFQNFGGGGARPVGVFDINIFNRNHRLNRKESINVFGEKKMKILLNGSPRGRFGHSGVLPAANLHCEHDGNSEIIKCSR